MPPTSPAELIVGEFKRVVDDRFRVALPAELAELGLAKTFPVFASLSEAVEHFLKTPL